MYPEVATQLEEQKFTNDEILHCTEGVGVDFAGGDSDTESVCDFDSGSGAKLRLKGRDPYCSVREPKDVPFRDQNFRRLVAPVMRETNGIPDFGWEFLYTEPADQPSILERIAKLNPQGNVIPHILLPINKRTNETDACILKPQNEKGVLKAF